MGKACALNFEGIKFVRAVKVPNNDVYEHLIHFLYSFAATTVINIVRSTHRLRRKDQNISGIRSIFHTFAWMEK